MDGREHFRCWRPSSPNSWDITSRLSSNARFLAYMTVHTVTDERGLSAHSSDLVVLDRTAGNKAIAADDVAWVQSRDSTDGVVDINDEGRLLFQSRDHRLTTEDLDDRFDSFVLER